ncbi:MAG: HDOD domain-containing protein [gamma proteobacterium symbiont of Taylorina sp.]|nr:HDOD domain-containing protein [gamma proteobacterium symbiont of Taylorina sp.]
MPSLSTTVTKVLEICNKPNVSPNDLNKIISLDPVLTGNVLKLINSSYYSLPHQITSLTRAIIVLGINTVKNLALTTAVLGTVKGGRKSALSMDEFWSHSLCVGVTAKALAAELKIPVNQREEFFLSGLLHDLGKIPMSQCFPDEYTQCISICAEKQIPLHEAEDIIFGFNHQQCGTIIADKWKLSNDIISVLKYHHTPEQSEDEYKTLTLCVAIANLYANIFAMESIKDYTYNEADALNLMEQSSLSWNNISPLHETIQDAIEKASVFLKVN